jgi:hypothetical protein
MYLLGLEANKFIISLGLILLIAGAIMYYCLRRFSVLENSIIQQGRVLHTFINKMEEEQKYNTRLHNQYNSTTEQQSVTPIPQMYQNNLTHTETNNLSDKIEVSDDEYDSGSSDESGNESSDDSGSDTSNEPIIESENNLENEVINEAINEVRNEVRNVSLEVQEILETPILDESVKVIEIEDIQPESITLNNISTLNLDSNSDTVIDSDSDSDSDSNSDNGKDYTTKKGNENDNDNENENDNENDNENSDINKMKVADLRDLVVSKGLVSNLVAANKLKKINLIEMLQQ